MATAEEFNPLDENLAKAVKESKLLLIGAGGIGCELLKDLVLAGFDDIHVIDLDTIDVSNLNRQFLFHKQHVGKSKAMIAKESAKLLNPKVNITAYHDSIMKPEFNVNFYKQFSAALNALDNIAARKHVNRMCLAADIPIVESGSAGYLGQVTVHKKKLSECYECTQQSAPKDYPTCTIRNTPSEPIHCIVWAKHLFNQLFGEEDPHQEVSPDPSDEIPPETPESSNSNSHETPKVSTPETPKVSTREWAKKYEYDAEMLFKKLFNEDIKYLLEMKHLWENRVPPSALEWDNLPDAVASGSQHVKPTLKDEEVWSIKECASVFQKSLSSLWKKLEEPSCNGQLVWDKDDDTCMDFVAACANIRACCFKITQECRFKIKSMAGNIIPAIATTNAVIAGLIVLQLFKIISGQIHKCQTVVLNRSITYARNKLISPCELWAANPNCFVCSPNAAEVLVKVNISTFNVKTLQEKVLMAKLNMVEPDVIIDNGKGTILISSDPEDMEGMSEKTLELFGIHNGTRLQCDDYFQNFKLVLVIDDDSELHNQEFQIVGDVSEIKPSKEEQQEKDEASSSKNQTNPPSDDEDDDGEISEVSFVTFSYKRKASDDENGINIPTKKSKKGRNILNIEGDEIEVL